ncbi:hypothetical protein Ancab_015059 [Ancistrocladus abbreviatus]
MSKLEPTPVEVDHRLAFIFQIDDDAEDMGKASTGIGEVEVYTEHGVDHPVFVDVLPPSTSEAVPQNEEGLTQEANVLESKVAIGDEDWSTDNCPMTTDAPQPKKSKGRSRKSSNNPSSANPHQTMEQPPSSTQEHPSHVQSSTAVK